MAVHIRLARHGAKKRPFYRIVVTDHRAKRDGRFLENIGTFDPTREVVNVDRERLSYWTGQGALLSDTAARAIRKAPTPEAAV